MQINSTPKIRIIQEVTVTADHSQHIWFAPYTESLKYQPRALQ